MASPYLVRIIAKPATGDVAPWLAWYQAEGLPATLAKTQATRAGLFHAYHAFTLQTKTPLDGAQTGLHETTLSQTIDLEPPADKVVLAMAQVDLAQEEDADALLQLARPPTAGPHAAVADVRLYRLIEDFDPRGLGHRLPPFVLNVQVLPADAVDYNTFYSGEHLHMLSRVPGYRRSQRYEFVAADTQVAARAAPRFMAVHEFNHLESMDGPELREADASPNTRRVFGNALKVNIRGFENVDVYGDVEK